MLGFLLLAAAERRDFGGLARAAIGFCSFFKAHDCSRAAIIAGACIGSCTWSFFAATFVLFPVVGLALRPLSGTLLDAAALSRPGASASACLP